MFSSRSYLRILSVSFYFCCSFILVPLSAKTGEIKVAVVVPDEFVRDAIRNTVRRAGYQVVEPASYEVAALEYFFTKEHPTHVVVDGSRGPSGDATLLVDLTSLRLSIGLGVERFLLLSSFAIYPENTTLPFPESAIAKIDVKSVQDPYRVAKLSVAKECIAKTQSGEFSGIVCPYPLLYGFHNTYNAPLENPVQHIRNRLIYAKHTNMEFVLVSNDGSASFELLHVDDLGQAVVALLFADVDHSVINIGTGVVTNIKQIAGYMHAQAGGKKELIFDMNCYDAVPLRVLNTRLIHDLGWHEAISLQKGLEEEVPL